MSNHELCPKCSASTLAPDDDHLRCLLCGLICDLIDRGGWVEVVEIV